jgi:hypothetical protein
MQTIGGLRRKLGLLTRKIDAVTRPPIVIIGKASDSEEQMLDRYELGNGFKPDPAIDDVLFLRVDYV